MAIPDPRTMSLGDLIVAAFDQAALFSSDPLEVSRLATQCLSRRLRNTPRITIGLRSAATAI